MNYLSVLFVLQIEGSFPVNSPPVLLGYTPSFGDSKSKTSADNQAQASIFVALDPPLMPPSPLSLSKLESLETDSIVAAVESWSETLRKQFPDRIIRPLVVNTEAKSCLVTRFVRPLNPPGQVLFDTTIVLEKMVIFLRATEVNNTDVRYLRIPIIVTVSVTSSGVTVTAILKTQSCFRYRIVRIVVTKSEKLIVENFALILVEMSASSEAELC